MNSITERVAAGAAFLDNHDPGWWAADADRPIDLDTLDLEKTDRCILGQRCPLETLAEYVGADSPDDLGYIDMGEAYYVNAVHLGSPAGRFAMAEWAISYGFNATHEEFAPLTAEWKRVITERRST